MTHPSKILQGLLGVLTTVGFFAVVYVTAREVIPGDNREMFMLLAGGALSSFNAIINFAFGSSVGSQRKDELMREERP